MENVGKMRWGGLREGFAEGVPELLEIKGRGGVAKRLCRAWE